MKFSVRKNFMEGNQEDRRLYLTRAAQRLVILGAVALLVLSLYFFRDDIADWYWEMQSRQQMQEMQSSGTYSRIAFEPDSDNIYTLFKDHLVVMNKGNFKVYASNGTELLSLQLSYSRPALCAGGSMIIAYDRGGRNLTVTSASSLIKTIETDAAEKIISVTMNDNGYFAMVHEAEKYRAVITVYDDKQNQIYQWKTPDYYVMRAVVSPDNSTMVVVAYTQKDGVFVSRIFYYQLNQDTASATCDIENTGISNVYFIGNDKICLIGDDRTVVADLAGNILYTHEYGSDRLLTYTAARDYVALSMQDRTSGLGAKIILFDAENTQAITVSTTDDIREMSANGDYIAVLYAQSIQIFGRDLKPLSGEVDVSQVRKILTTGEGRVLLIYASDAGYVDLLSAFRDKMDDSGSEEDE